MFTVSQDWNNHTKKVKFYLHQLCFCDVGTVLLRRHPFVVANIFLTDSKEFNLTNRCKVTDWAAEVSQKTWGDNRGKANESRGRVFLGVGFWKGFLWELWWVLSLAHKSWLEKSKYKDASTRIPKKNQISVLHLNHLNYQTPQKGQKFNGLTPMFHRPCPPLVVRTEDAARDRPCIKAKPLGAGIRLVEYPYLQQNHVLRRSQISFTVDLFD